MEATNSELTKFQDAPNCSNLFGYPDGSLEVIGPGTWIKFHVNFPSLLSAVHDSFSNSALLHNVGTLVLQGKVGQLEGAVVVAVVKTFLQKNFLTVSYQGGWPVGQLTVAVPSVNMLSMLTFLPCSPLCMTPFPTQRCCTMLGPLFYKGKLANLKELLWLQW